MRPKPGRRGRCSTRPNMTPTACTAASSARVRLGTCHFASTRPQTEWTLVQATSTWPDPRSHAHWLASALPLTRRGRMRDSAMRGREPPQARAVSTKGASGSRSRQCSRSCARRSGFEPGHIRAWKTDAEGEPLPPLFETRMRNADRERRLLDLAQPCRLEQPRQVAFAGAHQARFVVDLRVELTGCSPQRAEWTLTASVIPDASSHDTVLPRHAHHPRHARGRVQHDVDNKLRQGNVERLVRERQLLCGCLLHADRRMALPRGRDKRLGRIDRRHGSRPNPSDQLGRECTGTAANIGALADRPLHPQGRQAAVRAAPSTGPKTGHTHPREPRSSSAQSMPPNSRKPCTAWNRASVRLG